MKHISEWGISLGRVWLAAVPLLVALAVALTGCSDGQKAKVRFKVLATIAYQGKLITAWTVMECRYTRVEHSLTGMGGDTTLYGEALIFHVNERERFYILPSRRGKARGNIDRFWEYALLVALQISNPIGQLSDDDFKKISNASGHYSIDINRSQPLFIRFANENDPKTIEQLDPNILSNAWPGMQFHQLDIEITNEPVTENLRELLPWLDSESTERIFNTYPAGKRPPVKDRPLGFVINTGAFFGNGSLKWL